MLEFHCVVCMKMYYHDNDYLANNANGVTIATNTKAAAYYCHYDGRRQAGAYFSAQGHNTRTSQRT